MQNKKWVLCFSLTVAGFTGCGGGSGTGGGGSFTTSVPTGTKLTALTPSQAAQLCMDITNFDNKSIGPDACKLAGIGAASELMYTGTTAPTNAQLQAACTQGYNDCLTGDGGITSSPSDCDSTSYSDVPSTCTATVGDLQTCANDEVSTFNALYGTLPSCSQLTTTNLTAALSSFGGDAGATEPASCSTFDATCDTSSSKAHRGVLRRLHALKH